MTGEEHSELRWFPIAEACALPHLALADYGPILRQMMSK